MRFGLESSLELMLLPIVLWVVWVFGWDHCSSSGAVDEGPVLVGFELVVERAGPVEVVEFGDLVFGPRVPVVVLEAFGSVAAFNDAHGLVPHDRHFLRDRRTTTQMCDVRDGGSPGDNQLQDRLGQQFFRCRYRYGTKPCNLTNLTAGDSSALEGFEIDSNQPKMGQVLALRPQCRWRRWFG